MSGTHLAVELSENHARFSRLLKGEIKRELTVKFISPFVEEIREILNSTYRENDFLQENYDDYTLSWAGRKTTLIPFNVFGESSPGAIFNLCFNHVSIDYSIDYNRISELGIVNVFEIPDWVKSWFVIKHPRIIVQHDGSYLLRMALNSDTFKLKVLVILYDNYFLLILTRHNQLQYYSTFNYQNSDDVLYYISFTLQQKEMINEPGKIILVKGVGVSNEFIDEINFKINKIVDLKQLVIETPDAYSVKSHELCV